MKHAIITLVVCWLWAGCERPEPRGPLQSSQTAWVPPVHDEDEGIKLCEATKDSIGLKTAEVTERTEEGVVMLVAPKAAVLETTAGASVYVENGEHYKRSPVQLGRAFEEVVELTEGVYEGDRVVTAAAGMLWLIELRAVKGGKGCCPLPDAKPERRESAGNAH